MKNKAGIVLEYVWLVTGILALGAGIENSVKSGMSESYLFLIFAIISFIIWYLRRYRRMHSNNYE